jgi:hypothetical protein
LTRTYGKPALENAIESGIEKLSASKPSEAAEKRVAELLATASARP